MIDKSLIETIKSYQQLTIRIKSKPSFELSLKCISLLRLSVFTKVSTKLNNDLFRVYLMYHYDV